MCMHVFVGAGEWSVEYCTYTVWRGGTCARARVCVCVCVCALDLCWACIPPTVTVLGCCYSCVMQSLAKQIQTDPKIVYQSGLTPAKVSLLINLRTYSLHTHVAHTYIHTYMYAMLTLNASAMHHASELVYCSLTYACTVLFLQVPLVSGEHGDVSAFH